MCSSSSLLEKYKTIIKTCLTKEEILNVQEQFLAPIIETERLCFIQAEYARLQTIMGDEYHVGTEKHIFHPTTETSHSEIAELGDPTELTLKELSILPQLEKRIPRFGTISYMPLFRMTPEDSFRINLLSDIQENLATKTECHLQEIETLLNKHQTYIESKTKHDNVVIITT